MLDEHKVEQEPSTHAGETKYEGLRRWGEDMGGEGVSGRRRKRMEWVGPDGHQGVPGWTTGWETQHWQGVGTQIVGGPKIRVGLVSLRLVGSVDGGGLG